MMMNAAGAGADRTMMAPVRLLPLRLAFAVESLVNVNWAVRRVARVYLRSGWLINGGISKTIRNETCVSVFVLRSESRVRITTFGVAFSEWHFRSGTFGVARSVLQFACSRCGRLSLAVRAFSYSSVHYVRTLS